MQTIVERSIFPGMVVLICASGFFVTSPTAFAQSKKVNAIVKVYIDSTNVRHIVQSNGRDVEVPKEEGEVDFSSPVTADDKQSVGWLVYYDCCASYPTAGMLVIYRPERPLLRLRTGMMICAWHFVAGGKQVAFYTNTVHGDFGPHYELHDVRTGRLVKKLDGHLDEKSPRWTDGLE